MTHLGAGIDERVNPRTGEITGPRLSLTPTEFMTAVCSEFIPDSIPATATQSIDSTDYETHFKRRSRKKDAIPDAVDDPPDGVPDAPGHRAHPLIVSGAGLFPKVGPDDRLQHTYDPDPREGWRSGKNGNRSNTFIGDDLHLCADTPDLGAAGVPPLIRAASLVPAGSDKAVAGLAAIDALTDTPTEVLADRGYTQLKAERWARQLDKRGIDQVIDLKTTQRGTKPGPIDGTVFINGSVFTEALPKKLRNPPGSRRRADYDKLAPYVFVAFGERDREVGKQRYRGPALTGRLRCPNTPRSMRKPATATRPTTTCKPGSHCACGKTLVLGPGPKDLPGLRQSVIYGSTDWKASYGRRVSVESANSTCKIHHAKLERHSTRVLGTNRTAILVAFILAAVNASLMLSRYNYNLADPPAPGTPIVAKPTQREALHRTIKKFKGRRKRRKAKPDPPRGPDPDTTPELEGFAPIQ